MIWKICTVMVWTANVLVLSYFLILNTVYLATSTFAFRALRKYVRRVKAMNFEKFITSAVAPPITLIVPAYNEEATCIESTRSLLTLNYPDYEILLINDGSKDETERCLTSVFEMVPVARLPTASLPAGTVRKVLRSQRYQNLWLIDKENGGKADALNAGLNYTRTPLYAAMDADSVLERDALNRIVSPFLEDATTIAVGGIIRIANGCTIRSGIVESVRLPKKLLAQFQVLEYLRAFLAGRMGWNAIKATLIISGALGLFRRSVVVAAGGYATDTVGEDMELIVRLHHHCLKNKIPYRILYVPDPIAWTECPETLESLGRQRDRWQRGLVDSIWRHRQMLFNPRYGIIGLVAYPYFFFLEMMGPVIEFFGYAAFAVALALGLYSVYFIVAFFMVAFILGIVLSIAAVGLEELSLRRYRNLSDLIRLFLLAIAENFGYRQLSTFWRVKGVISSLRHVKGWGAMKRKGFRG